jgi:hypothetical protein
MAVDVLKLPPKLYRKNVTAATAFTPETRDTGSERTHIARPATNTRHGPRQIESTSPPARNAASVSFCGMTPFNLRPGRVVVHFTSHGTVAGAKKPHHNDGMR